MKVQIRFIKAWGHPTRNQIMGVGEVWWVSPWVADNLCPEYAERVEEGKSGKD